MHREILRVDWPTETWPKLPSRRGKFTFVDHRDGDGLNKQRSNIRPVQLVTESHDPGFVTRGESLQGESVVTVTSGGRRIAAYGKNRTGLIRDAGSITANTLVRAARFPEAKPCSHLGANLILVRGPAEAAVG
jgi:hypothetical protein